MILDEETNIALVLVDIVMEEQTSGLHLVKHIRDIKKDYNIRIVLRTGLSQDSFSEGKVMEDYEIDGYVLKSEFTKSKLNNLLYSSFRSFKNMLFVQNKELRLKQMHDKLEEQIIERTHILQLKNEELIIQQAELEKKNVSLQETELELKHKNAELLKSRKRIEEQKRIVETNARQKEQFLANMSHEIRTPLNAIIGFNELLAKSSLSTIQLRYIDNIRTSGKHLLGIIGDILDLTQIQNGTLERKNKNIDIFKLIAKIYEVMSLQARQKGLGLLLKIQPKLPQHILIDPVRIQQCLIHLLTNAIKFTEEGYVTLEIKHKDDLLKLSIKDTGLGIEKEEQSVIFDLFSQSNVENSRRYGGTGIGLTIVKHVVDLLGGELNFESTVNIGSEFIINIPFCEGVPIEEHKEEPILIPSDIHVLLVEDNIMNIEMARMVLNSNIKQLKLDIAKNGLEAYELTSQNFYDIILMDMQMPVMDGLKATKKIRSELSPLRKHVPIMAVTANVLDKERQKCFDAGMDEYISKPFKAKELLEKMYFLLQKDKL